MNVQTFPVNGRSVSVFHYLRRHHPGDTRSGRATGWYWWSEGHGGGPFTAGREALDAARRESNWTITAATIVAHVRFRLHTGQFVGVLTDRGAQLL